MAQLLVKPYREKNAGYCGPATLKMVLEYYNTYKSEEELAHLTKTTQEKGMKIENAVEGLKKLGFDTQIKDFADFNDIRSYINNNIPVVVDWFSTDDGHFSVVIDIDDKNIYLQDPELGNLRTMNLTTFYRVWFDFQNEFITSKTDMIIRRIIIIRPNDKS